jgi:hypothetical protein
MRTAVFIEGGSADVEGVIGSMRCSAWWPASSRAIKPMLARRTLEEPDPTAAVRAGAHRRRQAASRPGRPLAVAGPLRPGTSLADELALLTATALLAVLRAPGPDRFRHCAAPTCDGMFVDTSRGAAGIREKPAKRSVVPGQASVSARAR